ncbi:MltA domain-containing protein [Rickettsiales bacterium]|nr:MltA domain-containing protein [Rickettsiales bacterium]
MPIGLNLHKLCAITFFVTLYGFSNKAVSHEGGNNESNKKTVSHKSENNESDKNDKIHKAFEYHGMIDIPNQDLHDFDYYIEGSGYGVTGKGYIQRKSSPKNSIEGILNNNVYIKENYDKGILKTKLKPIKTPHMILVPTIFSELNNWNTDHFEHALESFLNTCKIFQARKKTASTTIKSKDIDVGNIATWIDICQKGKTYLEQGKAKDFFETYFRPFLIINRKTGNSKGRFTAYNELSIKCSPKKTLKYKHPIYQKPPQCKSFSTCPSRMQINMGAIKNKGLELCWTKSQFDIWKLQMQGSGIVIYPNQTMRRVSFGGSNYHKTTNIWSIINDHIPIKQNGGTKMIKTIMEKNSIGMKIANRNPQYTFFSKNNRSFAVGGHGSRLTPGRSIAIDVQFIPYGVPLWVDTHAPIREPNKKEFAKLQRIMISQDAGSAIKGVIRGDIFYGHGNKAKCLADGTNFKGQYYILLPKEAIASTKAIV